MYNITYSYDYKGNVLTEERSGAYPLTKNFGYTKDNELERTTYTVGGQSLAYTYETDNTPDKRNSKVTLPFWIKQELTYDGLGRTREISLGEKLVKDIYYQKFGDHATNRVSTVWYGVNNVRKDSLKYTYDKAGNIETVTENGKLVARYKYDGLNRLIREDNVKFGTVIYCYDSAGNILSKTHYAFTLKDELGEVVNEYEYSYRQHGWRDQLLSFNGIKCKYDALGNPLSYKGRTLTWQGRRLISYGIENKKATYSYDFNNVRTSKTATDGTTSVTSKYIYDGNNLIAEQRTVKGPDKDKSVWIYYIYGVDGIAGFKFEDKVYLYRKNVQGDITHIYRKDGNKDLVEVAHYAYDAFGNTEILSETDKIGSLNPFRYRGYYYDIETKLYYLISRYYDPETCRFISADSIEYLDPETLGGLNLYAYCCNNPVMRKDFDGTDWNSFWNKVKNGFKKAGEWINDKIIQPTVTFFEENWDLVVAGILFVGAIVATVATFGVGGALIGMAAGAIVGVACGGLNSYLTGGSVWQGMLNGLVVGAFGGVSAIAGGLAAAGMSIVMDRVNGKKAGKDTIIRAAFNGVVAGVFAKGAKHFSDICVKGEGVLVTWVVNFAYANLFTFGNVAFDLTVKKFKDVYGK